MNVALSTFRDFCEVLPKNAKTAILRWILFHCFLHLKSCKLPKTVENVHTRDIYGLINLSISKQSHILKNQFKNKANVEQDTFLDFAGISS